MKLFKETEPLTKDSEEPKRNVICTVIGVAITILLAVAAVGTSALLVLALIKYLTT